MDIEDKICLKPSIVKAINALCEKLRHKEEAEEENLYKYQNLQQEIALEKAKLDQLKLSVARNQPVQVDASVFNFKLALLAERKKALESILDEKESKTLKLEEIEFALEQKRREAATQTAQLANRWVPTVAGRLGCRIDRRDEEQAVDITFWNIDPDDCERTFTFSLGLHQNHVDRYAVLECDPYVSELDQMVSTLNRTSSLPQFMTAMRLAFKSCCRASQQRRKSTRVTDSHEDEHFRTLKEFEPPRRYDDFPRYRALGTRSRDEEREVTILNARSPMDMFRTAQSEGSNVLFLTPTRKGVAHF